MSQKQIMVGDIVDNVPVHTNFDPGDSLVTPDGIALDVYTALPNTWLTNDPATLCVAIDRLAATLRYHLQAPIPDISPLTITTPETLQFEVGSNANVQFAANGGVEPRLWSFQDLPAWLSGNSAGLVTGTTQGVFTGDFVVTVTDGVVSVQKTVSIVVA